MSIELKDTIPDIDINTRVDIREILNITYFDITYSDNKINKIMNDILNYNIEQLNTLPLNYYYSVILCYLYYKYSSNDYIFLSAILSRKSLNFNIKYLDFIYFISACIYISFIYNDDINTINKLCASRAESNDFDEQSIQEYKNKLINNLKVNGVFDINNDNFKTYLKCNKDFNIFFKNIISKKDVADVYDDYYNNDTKYAKYIKKFTTQLNDNLIKNYTNYHNDYSKIDDIIRYTFNNDINNYYKKILISYIWQVDYKDLQNRIVNIFNVKNGVKNSYTEKDISEQEMAYQYFKNYYGYMIVILSSYISNNIENLNYCKLICVFEHLKIAYKSYVLYPKKYDYSDIVKSLNNICICDKQYGGKYDKLFL